MATISNPVGANNKFSAFQSTDIDASWEILRGDYFQLVATRSVDGCITMISIFTANQLAPSAGVEHSLNPNHGSASSQWGSMEYYEENCEGVVRTKLWRSTDGTLSFDAVSGSRVSLSWTGVPMMAVPPSSLDGPGYSGAGTLELTGSAVVDVRGL